MDFEPVQFPDLWFFNKYLLACQFHFKLLLIWNQKKKLNGYFFVEKLFKESKI